MLFRAPSWWTLGRVPSDWQISHRIRGKDANLAVDAAISALASTQHGLVTTAQLVDLGLTRRMIEVRIAAGRLHPVHRGVYSVGTPPRTREARWLAAVLACGPGAFLSHRSAAALWTVRATSATRIDVTSPSGRGRRRLGLNVFRKAVDPQDITERNGIPVTTLARTIIDLAAVVPGSAEYAIHRAESRRMITPDEIRRALARLPGAAGTPAVRAIVGTPHHDLDAQTRSRWERELLAICRAHDIAEPQVNRWIALDIPAGGLEVDFCWPEQGLVLEVDDEATHHTLRARRNDPERDSALTAAGWLPLRIPERDFARPGAIAERLQRLTPTSVSSPVAWRRRS